MTSVYTWRLYKSCVCSILTYGSETWYMDVETKRALWWVCWPARHNIKRHHHQSGGSLIWWYGCGQDDYSGLSTYSEWSQIASSSRQCSRCLSAGRQGTRLWTHRIMRHDGRFVHMRWTRIDGEWWGNRGWRWICQSNLNQNPFPSTIGNIMTLTRVTNIADALGCKTHRVEIFHQTKQSAATHHECQTAWSSTRGELCSPSAIIWTQQLVTRAVMMLIVLSDGKFPLTIP